MAMTTGSRYGALVEGGTSVSSAQRAAGELADYQMRRSDMRVDLKLLKGMVGIAVSGVVALVVKAFLT